MQSFGEKLRDIRKSKNMSLEEFAELLDTSKQVLSRYERQERIPKITTVITFLRKLNIPLGILNDCKGEENE